MSPPLQFVCANGHTTQGVRRRGYLFGPVGGSMPSDWSPSAVADRPRLLISPESVERTLAAIDESERAAARFDSICSRANELLDEPTTEYGLPDGIRLLSQSRTVLGRILDLGTCHLLTGESRYADRAWTELAAVAAYPDWNPGHFLDVAEMTAAVAVGYDWCYDHWDADQRTRLAAAIADEAFEHALPGYRSEPGNRAEHTNWLDSTHNWNTVCNGGLTMGAIALLGDGLVETADLVTVVEGARESIERPIGTIGPNGGWREGVGYWGYNTQYLCYYLASVTNALGTDFGFLDRPGLADLGTVPIHMTSHGGGAFGFGDARGGGRIRQPALYWLASTFDRPTYAGYQDASLRERASGKSSRGDALNLLWYDPDLVADPETANEAPERYFPGGDETVTMRERWADPNAAFCGFKAGDNQTNHGSLDAGTFVYDVNGVRWLTGLGSNDYNVPGYWEMGPDGSRWQYYRKRAEGNNTLVLDPDAGPDQDPLGASCIETVYATERAAVAVTDLSPAYPDATVRRGVGLIDSRRECYVRDEITAPEGPLWWFAHSAADLHVDGRRATLEREDERITAAIVAPEDATFQVRDTTPLPSSPSPDAQEPVEDVRKLAIHRSEADETAIEVRLGPTAAPDESPIPLSQWTGSDSP